jgi:hypothetical protein
MAEKHRRFNDDLKGGPYGRLDWVGYPLALKTQAERSGDVCVSTVSIVCTTDVYSLTPARMA